METTAADLYERASSGTGPRRSGESRIATREIRKSVELEFMLLLSRTFHQRLQIGSVHLTIFLIHL